MDNPYIGRVNQQFIFARHQLQSRLEEKNANDRMRNQGVLHAGIWHLRWAYRAYLSEVAANYKAPNPDRASTANELSLLLESINKHPAESQELQKLELQGFVCDFLQALNSIEQIESGLIPPAPTGFPNPLSMKDVTELKEEVQIDFDKLSDWINSLKELIARHREHMIEY